MSPFPRRSRQCYVGGSAGGQCAPPVSPAPISPRKRCTTAATHVWYTRYAHDASWMTTWRTSNCTRIWLATSADGVSWSEHGQVLEDSDQTAWHGEGKHAPAVVCHDGRYYLYFCAHTGAPMNEKHIGVALADSGTVVRFSAGIPAAFGRTGRDRADCRRKTAGSSGLLQPGRVPIREGGGHRCAHQRSGSVQCRCLRQHKPRKRRRLGTLAALRRKQAAHQSTRATAIRIVRGTLGLRHARSGGY